jgi:hypothetical protein
MASALFGSDAGPEQVEIDYRQAISVPDWKITAWVGVGAALEGLT